MNKNILCCFACLTVTLSAVGQVEVNPTTFGAVPNDNLDDTAAMQAAVDSAAAQGGGLVRVPAGTFKLSGRVTVGHLVDFRGAGMYATQFTCTTSNAGISFFVANPTQIPRGGTSGHFHLKGDNISLNPLYIGWCAVRQFERIRVENAVEVGMKLEEVQNSFFVGLQVVKSGKENVIIDLSSRTLGFYECVFSGFGTDGVLIQQSGTPAHSGGPRCNKIHFYGGITERSGSSAVGGGAITVTDGTDVLIDGLNTSGAGIRLRRDLAVFPNARVERITLRNSELQGSPQFPIIDIKGGNLNAPITVFLESGLNFRSGSVALETDDGAEIHAVSYVKAANVPFWQNVGGIKPQEEVVRDLGQRQAALTGPDNTALSTTFNNAERETLVTVINNMRTRINELEARLMLSGLIQSQ